MTSGIFRTRGWSRFTFIVLALLIALVMAASASADEKGRANDVTQDVGFVAIEGSPLTINVAKDASYQVIECFGQTCDRTQVNRRYVKRG